ncbi:MAG: N-acetylgalactosamine-4-sulfatase, partial [Planctomycetaceae bacterium]|nr:N-acetylgalactosamine-4-sulfatase [Planctomycetaceae bacterium]
AWWTELEPTFQQDTAISLGHPSDNPARLTSHDWITTQMTPWNQAQIRQAMNGPQNTGFWNINVLKAGTYEVRLRRWPAEANQPLGAAVAPGEPVPGTRAFRTTPGKAIAPVKVSLKIGEQTWEAKTSPEDLEATITVELPAGRFRMSALFETADGDVYGAYYAYVTRKE